jgi:hypothetical protein
MSFTFVPEDYGPAVAGLLTGSHEPDLGPGVPNRSAKSLLQALTVDAIASGRNIVDSQLAQCCLSGLWLWHNYLHESHVISQDIDTAEGSFWHGIMHRREPDYGNAKYWFRHVGTHPVYAALGAEPLVQSLLGKAPWDPFAFVDLCQATAEGKDRRLSEATQVAQLEWQLLFDYCYRGAT